MNKLDDNIITKIKDLRLNGLSLNQIVDELNIGKSTASKYCKGLRPNNPNRKGCNKHATLAAKKKWKNRIDQVVLEAKNEWDSIKQRPDVMGFLGLYWGEGYKYGSIGITNNDPDIIRIAFKFFRIFDPHKTIKITIIYYDSHNEEECYNFWKAIFDNNISIKIMKNTDVRSKSEFDIRCPHGRCMVRYNNWKIYHKIITWINCWRHE